jgi:Putative addiction module component
MASYGLPRRDALRTHAYRMMQRYTQQQSSACLMGNLEKNMSNTLEALEAEVLRLEPAERARLLERLIESFEPDDLIQNMWLAEARRREDDVLAGRTSMVPGHEAIARVRARIA